MKLFSVLAGAIVIAVCAAPAAHAAKSSGCEQLDTRECLLPWPSNHFTKADKGADTGLRLNLKASQFPKNNSGAAAFAPELNQNDGFSPGTGIITYVPGLDLKRSKAVPVNDIARYADRNAPIVVIDAKTRKRWPIWAELDSQATAKSDKVLTIHPARNFLEGHRYIVALRNMKDSAGRTIRPGKAFRALRDGSRTPDRALAARRGQFADLFRTLGRAGISRSSLYLAWDFTVASERNLSERALSIRDDAFAQLGDRNLSDGKVEGSSPPFTVDSVTDFTTCGGDGCQDGENDQVARRVSGTLTVPCYLDRPGCPSGSKFAYASQGKGAFKWLPKRAAGNTMAARFFCTIPRAAFSAPARGTLYGHGLLGNPEKETLARDIQAMTQEHDFVYCATREVGMADEDVPNAIATLTDMSKFATIADRMQQGILNSLLLGRAMIHPQGLISNAAFRTPGGAPLIDTANLFYDGNSQGGIMGGAVTALSPDLRRSVLGVPGMNFSLLLQRSVDWDTYTSVLKPAYPSELDRLLMLNVVQNLWDRGEGNGYAHHMTRDPLKNTPSHSVMLHVGLGDHQVAQVSAENEARTIGARSRQPGYDAGRSFDKQAFWGIPAIGASNPDAAIVMWDTGPVRDGGKYGTDVAPIQNLAPRNGEDPHGIVRNAVAARTQKSEWLKAGGRFVDVCPAARACRTDDWPY